MPNRKIIVFAGTSADGFIARPDGDIDWLTSRPKPKGFYGMGEFTASIDTKILGRKTYEKSLALGAKFDGKTKTYVFSTRPDALVPDAGVDLVSEAIEPFAHRLRAAAASSPLSSTPAPSIS
jgi:dihydrofolate reductase